MSWGINIALRNSKIKSHFGFKIDSFVKMKNSFSGKEEVLEDVFSKFLNVKEIN